DLVSGSGQSPSQGRCSPCRRPPPVPAWQRSPRPPSGHPDPGLCARHIWAYLAGTLSAGGPGHHDLLCPRSMTAFVDSPLTGHRSPYVSRWFPLTRAARPGPWVHGSDVVDEHVDLRLGARQVSVPVEVGDARL